MSTRRRKAKVFLPKKAAKTFQIGDQTGGGTSFGDAKAPTSLLDFNLEDEQIEQAIQCIENVEKVKKEGGATFEQLIMREAAAAGLKGSREFENMLRANRGKKAPRGGSEDSRPPKRQSQEGGEGEEETSKR